MKYLKLFENFDDILYDIEDILVTLNPADTNSDKPELLRSELDNNLLFYKVEHNYSKDDLNTSILRLEDLGYYILHHSINGPILFKSDYFKDKTIKGVCLQWLNEKFGKGKLKIDKDTKAINYVNDNGENIIRFYKDKDDNFLINNDLVWSLFDKGFILSYDTTQEIISTWLKETYKLTGKANRFSWGVMDEDNLED